MMKYGKVRYSIVTMYGIPTSECEVLAVRSYMVLRAQRFRPRSGKRLMAAAIFRVELGLRAENAFSPSD